jgi:hypothetical protein
MRHIIEMCLDQEVQMRSDQSLNVSPARENIGFKAREPRQSGGPLWTRACVGLVFAAAFTCVAQNGQPAAAPAAQPNAIPQAQTSSPASAKPVADPLDKPRGEESSPQPQSPPSPPSPPDSQRRKQISTESTQLLAMAVELKAEVDKTNKDTLSMNVIRKADAIEKLAKTVKEKMKQSSGPG